MIILIGGEKGGTGKTTLATNLASLFANDNEDVFIMDTDRQGSASDWCSIRAMNNSLKRIPCMQKFGGNIAHEILDLSFRYKNIIIDAGGHDSVELRSAMTVVDEMYIPLQASQFDVWTIGTMDNIVALSKTINPKLNASFIINRASTHPSVSSYDKILPVFKDIQNLKIMSHVIHDRSAYQKAAQLGKSVSELVPVDYKASQEITILYNKIRNKDD